MIIIKNSSDIDNKNISDNNHSDNDNNNLVLLTKGIATLVFILLFQRAIAGIPIFT